MVIFRSADPTIHSIAWFLLQHLIPERDVLRIELLVVSSGIANPIIHCTGVLFFSKAKSMQRETSCWISNTGLVSPRHTLDQGSPILDAKDQCGCKLSFQANWRFACWLMGDRVN